VALQIRIALAQHAQQFGQAAGIAADLPRSAGVLAKRGGNVDLNAHECAPVKTVSGFMFREEGSKVSQVSRFRRNFEFQA
jgi:hypothetical protein